MRLGGIDPSILRELSGVYKPFVKAFKELISNAFDADADQVIVEFTPDFSAVTITDDGCGMTPFEFRNDFTRIGGGSRRWTGDRTRKGRLRIGSKGIGFLALARYCGQLRVESSADRPFKAVAKFAAPGRAVDLQGLIGLSLDAGFLKNRLKCAVSRGRGRLREGKHYRLDLAKQRIIFCSAETGTIDVHLSIDCRHLGFSATLDFDRLLKLADSADLESIDDFASIELKQVEGQQGGTRIAAEKLRPFVTRDLRTDRRKGFVRNVQGRSGFEQFLWHLSRCTPIEYADAPTVQGDLKALLTRERRSSLQELRVAHGNRATAVRRPIYPFEDATPAVPGDMLVKVSINEAGLRATGFLAGYENIIFPAEYRGVSVRVRGVAIGEAGFFGAEHLLTGANKAALSQITGEIVVHSGLDAVDTLNPGRESFYEESEQYKALRRHLIGDGEQVGGVIGRAVAAVLRRSQVRSALADVLGRMSIRRHALEDVSAAITNLVSREDGIAEAVCAMLQSKSQHVNGLVSAPDHEFGLPPRIGGLAVKVGEGLAEAAEIDYAAGQVTLDQARPEWSWSMLLHDRRFDVLHKKGRADQPLAEIDIKHGRIYINWAHPIKLQMDERGFLRCALAFAIAREVRCRDIDQTMNLTLQLLSFATQSNG